jgi:hypothetical protein
VTEVNWAGQLQPPRSAAAPAGDARAGARDRPRGAADRIRPVLQVSEIRTIAGDRLWISPQYRRDTIGIHFTWTPEPEPVARVLADVEAALAPLEARPTGARSSSRRPRRSRLCTSGCPTSCGSWSGSTRVGRSATSGWRRACWAAAELRNWALQGTRSAGQRCTRAVDRPPVSRPRTTGPTAPAPPCPSIPHGRFARPRTRSRGTCAGR